MPSKTLDRKQRDSVLQNQPQRQTLLYTLIGVNTVLPIIPRDHMILGRSLFDRRSALSRGDSTLHQPARRDQG